MHRRGHAVMITAEITVAFYARVLTKLHDRLMAEQLPYTFQGRPIFWVRRARRAWIDDEVGRLAALEARVIASHGVAAARRVPVPVVLADADEIRIEAGREITAHVRGEQGWSRVPLTAAGVIVVQDEQPLILGVDAHIPAPSGESHARAGRARARTGAGPASERKGAR